MLLKTSGANYLKYRTWTLTAAKNLTPGDCANFNKVKGAWDAISVPAQSADPTCTPSGSSPVPNNPGNQSSQVGQSASLQLTASGGTTPYTWSFTGLPTGLSGSASGLISGTTTTAGTFNVTATVTDSSSPAKSGSAQFTWTVGDTPPPQCTGNKLLNPGFESGTASWTSSSGVIGQNGSDEPTHGGTWNAWLDGYGQSHTDTLSQAVAIPANCHATLTFFLHIDSGETTTTVQYDKLTVQANSTTLGTFSNLNKASGYAQKTFDVSALAGHTVTFKFTGVEDSSLQTSFVIDDGAVTLS